MREEEDDIEEEIEVESERRGGEGRKKGDKNEEGRGGEGRKRGDKNEKRRDIGRRGE